MKTLITCKEGFEKVLAREGVLFGLTATLQGQGWVLSEGDVLRPFDENGGICFACNILRNVDDIRASSSNSFSENLLEVFLTHLGERRITETWQVCFFSSGKEQLIHHAQTIEARWFEKLKKKMSRVSQLADKGIPRGPLWHSGFFVCITDFNQAYVGFEAVSQGQERMKMDPLAPSRSYLKLEEAFHLGNVSPKEGETVVDLGAAPGGWSYGALKRGASVTAVDNGPLREPVKSHDQMTHLKRDALTYFPSGADSLDWLLCDVLETPEVMIEVLRKWILSRRCRRFVVNLKLGRRDPIAVLKILRDPHKGLLPYCDSFFLRQLYHDRDEITLIGRVKGVERQNSGTGLTAVQ